ncbi:MAG TPA: PAS domain-containing protein [Stellaceae bacterium]|nr:PAS domain-containing protein [Stellaceae bacterium]
MKTLEPAGTIDEALLAAPHDQTNRRFIAAWLGWRGATRRLPRRSMVELADIKELLGRVMLFELLGPDEIRVKVAGSQLRDHADFEATGRNLADLTPPEEWPIRRWRMNEAARLPCGAHMVNIDTQTRSGEGAAFETLTLPIEPDEPGKPPLLMSNIAVLGGVYDPPAEGRPQVFHIPEQFRFRFLDLGAGIPTTTMP